MRDDKSRGFKVPAGTGAEMAPPDGKRHQRQDMSSLRREQDDYRRGDFLLFAHRGASGYEPENTLRAFRRALVMGARWLELDVYAVEGELVVIHDATLERTTNGKGAVMEQTLRRLRALDAGRGERIPLLREVLDLLGRDNGVNIELKGPATAAPVAELLGTYLERSRLMPEQLLISAFDQEELAAFQTLLPHIRIAPIVTGVPRGYARNAAALGAYAVHAALPAATKRFIADAHGRGLKFFVFTVNTRQDPERMRARGVDGVFTNYPDILCRDP